MMLKATIGDKRPKGLQVAAFRPQTEFIWEEKDIETVVDEFRDYIQKAWEEGCYLKVER